MNEWIPYVVIGVVIGWSLDILFLSILEWLKSKKEIK